MGPIRELNCPQMKPNTFAMVLLATSAWLLHCGWCAVVVLWRTVRWPQNSFPWSVTTSSGQPCLQIHFSKIALATVSDSVLGRATSSTHLVNASVMQRMNFFEWPETLKGPNSMDALVGFSELRQRWQQCWSRWVVLLFHLALVASLDVVIDVFVHARPEVTAQDPFYGFQHTIMSWE